MIFRLKAQIQVFKQKLKRKSQQSVQGEAKPVEEELIQNRDTRSFFVFKGTKTSKRDRKEKTAKFVIDLSDQKNILLLIP